MALSVVIHSRLMLCAISLSALTGSLPAAAVEGRVSIQKPAREIPAQRTEPHQTSITDPINASLDSRLSQKFTFGVKNLPFTDFCKQLGAKSEVSFAADQYVADDKITLFCTDRPIADILQQIAILFDFTWERTGSAPAYRYLLTQSREARLKEAALRARENDSGLALLDKEMEQYRPYLGLTIGQLDNLIASSTGVEKERARYFRNVQMSPATVFLTLAPAGREALSKGTTLMFSSQSAGPQALPSNLTQALSAYWLSESTYQHSTNGKEDTQEYREAIRKASDANWIVRITLARKSAGRFTFEFHTGFSVPSLNIYNQDMFSGGQALRPAVDAALDNARLNAALAPLAEMRKPITIDLMPSGTVDPALWHTAQMTTGPIVTAADIETAIHIATGADVIADSFAGAYPPGMLNAHETPLFDVMCRDSDRMHLQWSKQDGFLRFRNVRYYQQRLSEVPDRLLTRWATARAARGALSGPEVAEIAALSDAQLDSDAVAAVAIAYYGLKEWALVVKPDLRPHWQLLGAIPQAQRNSAFMPQGLPFSQVPMKLERRFQDLAWGSPTAVDSANYRDRIRANLRVEYTMPPHRDPPGAISSLPGGKSENAQNQFASVPEQNERIQWHVKFIYTYGGPEKGRWRRIIEPDRMSTGEPGTFKE